MADEQGCGERGGRPARVGSPKGILVRDPRIGTFIQMLGELMAHPERFDDEVVLDNPHVSRPDGDA